MGGFLWWAPFCGLYADSWPLLPGCAFEGLVCECCKRAVEALWEQPVLTTKGQPIACHLPMDRVYCSPFYCLVCESRSNSL